MQYGTTLRNNFNRLRKHILNGKKLFGANGTANALPSLKLAGDEADISADRHEPCYLLWKSNTPAVVWFEDLLVLHDCVTQLQDLDLHLLVSNPDEAAATLRSAGYGETPLNARAELSPKFLERGKRMAVKLSENGTGVVLLPAQDWYYELDETADGFLPPLHHFIDSMMETWLQISSRDYEENLLFALYVSRLITYCYKLHDENGRPVKESTYADMLQDAHRELHYDIISEDPKSESFTTTKRHQFHVRRSKDIREGLFTPHPYQKGVYRPELTTLTE